jgi:hypothetical protein
LKKLLHDPFRDWPQLAQSEIAPNLQAPLNQIWLQEFYWHSYQSTGSNRTNIFKKQPTFEILPLVFKNAA